MNIYKTVLSIVSSVLISGSALAQTAGPNASCTFANCSAQIVGASSLQVSCDSASIYSGTYELNSDLKTIQIQADGTGGPLITVAGLPVSGAPIKATLLVSGKSTEGSCTFNSK